MYGQHATEIVGYTFNADIYCPEHVLTAVKATHPLDYPLASTILPEDTAEDILRTVAKSLRLTDTFDTAEFPSPIFASDAWAQYEPDHCAVCGSEIE